MVTLENEKDKEEGVIYYEDKEIVDIINNTDNNISSKEWNYHKTSAYNILYYKV